MTNTSSPASGSVSDSSPKRHTWLWWLLGGLGALSLLCVVGSVVVVFALYQIGKSQMALTAASSSAVAIYDPLADSQQEIDQALDIAKRDNKLVLLDFGADWCPDCVVLARHMESVTVQPFLDDNYVVVRVNVGQWDANLDIVEQYGNPIAKGIPAVVVVDARNQVVASTGGGELASARTSTREEILMLLKQWVSKE